ncbi:hypothetical protein ACU8V1_33810 (plasmid) [Rhizobium leguminosarum]|uniref:hypothetical protein n=1 Tax=Rhizobium leguminosarum TaxID=384 RepID=UPI001440E848|nr:hypothetical protein [Rhizobium leguminosarum]NKK47115.1 hypothetical protein [Rhizobium leguminosarum bv. viciae]
MAGSQRFVGKGRALPYHDELAVMDAVELSEKLDVPLPVISALVWDGYLSAIHVLRARRILMSKVQAEKFASQHSIRPQNKGDVPVITEYEVGVNFYQL